MLRKISSCGLDHMVTRLCGYVFNGYSGVPYVRELLVEGFRISEDLSIHGRGSRLVGVEKARRSH